MTPADGLVVELVASEPHVRQPVAIEFDDRGRLWVVQYLQYPNPAGLKRVEVDRYSRTTYDRVPEPPPHGPPGADRISILLDEDGDGRIDRSKDFVSGLNLTTGIALGHGGVFVLNVPYLLFYPDKDRDDVPDTDPEVLLEGFGMEDSSSLANSLTWGPDGWLYGTQGTNITADIRGIEFEQGVWRYHPVTREFELFCEGGGNSWGLDFDRYGNLFYSTNHGGYLMHHGVQGAYLGKSFSKHGELHNPFAFGYFDHVPHDDFRGGHVTVGGLFYQGNALPARYRDKYIAADLLDHAVRWHRVHPTGSTFRSENGGTLVMANDTWFAPSDVLVGPDGGVYVADWHDKRTAHPDPDADWDRSNGRIFRIRSSAAQRGKPADAHALSSQQLVKWLTRDSGWHRRRARRILAERQDPSVLPMLQRRVLQGDNETFGLEALWALYGCGGMDASLAQRLIEHRSPWVRSWTVRLMGDARRVPSELASRFAEMGARERNPVVVSQLACTARRLPPAQALPILRAIAVQDDWVDDPYIPLLVWWAVEQHALSAIDELVDWCCSPRAWQQPMVRDAIVGRLVRRYAGEGSRETLTACAQLLRAAPTPADQRNLLVNLDAGLKMIGRPEPDGLPMGTAFTRFAVVSAGRPNRATRLESVSDELANWMRRFEVQDTIDPLFIRVAMRLGSERAESRAIALACDDAQPVELREAMLEVLQELGGPDCAKQLLTLLDAEQPDRIRLATLNALRGFDGPRIARVVLDRYGGMSAPVRRHARRLLFDRTPWARALLEAIDKAMFSADEVSLDEVRRLSRHGDRRIDALVRKHWGEVRAGTPEEKLAEVRRLQNDLRAASGDLGQGRQLFEKLCSTCHKMDGKGNSIGPELTTANRQDREFLLISLVDPSVQVRKEFLSYVVRTRDGRILSGLLAEENAAGIILVNEKNERVEVRRDEIDEMRPSPTSLMPEDLLKPLTPQQVRDLFAYLHNSTQPPAQTTP